MGKITMTKGDLSLAATAAAAGRVDWLNKTSEAVAGLADFNPSRTASRIVWDSMNEGGYNVRFTDPENPAQVKIPPGYGLLMGANLRSFALQMPASADRVGPLAGLPFMFTVGKETNSALKVALGRKDGAPLNHMLNFIADASPDARPLPPDPGSATMVIQPLGDKARVVFTALVTTLDPILPVARIGGTWHGKVEMARTLGKLSASVGVTVKTGDPALLLSLI